MRYVAMNAAELPTAPGPARLVGMSNPTDAPQQWKFHTATAPWLSAHRESV
jgi:hypothetical protein